MSKLSKVQLKKSLDYSIKDGCAWSVMNSFTDPFVIPYAVPLNASPFQVGLLRGLPLLFSALTQPLSAAISEHLGQKKWLVFWTAAVQAFALLLISLIPLFFAQGALIWLIAFWVVAIASFRLGNAPWTAWMNGILPKRGRGNYLGNRSMICGLVGLAGLTAASTLLSFGGSIAGALKIFSLLFFSAFCFR